MKDRYKLLLIEDDQSLAHYTQSILDMNGYDVACVGNGADARLMAASHCPDLILMDIGLPDMDGILLLRELRSWTGLPVIVMTSHAEDEKKIEAMENGASDYVLKPFGKSELLASISNLLNTGGSMPEQTEITTVGDLVVDSGKHCVYADGKRVELTQNEFRIVSFLAQEAGRLVRYDELLTRLWGPNAAGDNQILRVNMANIRRKLENDPSHPKYIHTENGLGYIMMVND